MANLTNFSFLWKQSSRTLRNDFIKSVAICFLPVHRNPCLNGGIYAEVHHDYICICPKEFRGKNCQDRNYCSSGPCKNNGACEEMVNGYKCLCARGFMGNHCEGENYYVHQTITFGIWFLGGLVCPLAFYNKLSWFVSELPEKHILYRGGPM